MMEMINKKRNKKGFTLIELIVVIAILGILAAIAIPRLTGFQETARDNAHEANLKTLRSSASLYLAENGNPDSDMDTTATKIALEGAYIEEWPKTPFKTGGAEYTVAINKEGVITVAGGKTASGGGTGEGTGD